MPRAASDSGVVSSPPIKVYSLAEFISQQEALTKLAHSGHPIVIKDGDNEIRLGFKNPTDAERRENLAEQESEDRRPARNKQCQTYDKNKESSEVV